MKCLDPSGDLRVLSLSWLAVIVGSLLTFALVSDAFAQPVITLPRPSRDVRVRDTAPTWLAMPQRGRIRTSPGLKLRPLQNSAVTYETYENAKVGVLVGALRNAGPCAARLTIQLQYTDHKWQPLGKPVENQARVSQVDSGGALPYRFGLRRKDEFSQLPSGYIIEVSENGRPVPPITDEVEFVRGDRSVAVTSCSQLPDPLDISIESSRPTSRGHKVNGIVTVKAGGSIHPKGIALTALLLDKEGKVLEVLTGGVTYQSDGSTGLIDIGETVRFSLSTSIPLGNSVDRTEMFAEVKTEM